VIGEVVVDRGLELHHRVEAAALEPTPGGRREERLDRVQSRARGRHKVEGPAGMVRQLGEHPCSGTRPDFLNGLSQLRKSGRDRQHLFSAPAAALFRTCKRMSRRMSEEAFRET
jgi:hypothetical protein